MEGLEDAQVKLNRARHVWNELVDVMKAWIESGQGITTFLQSDPELALDTWYICKLSEPSQPIEAICGDIMDNLRNCLDFIAWQIYIQSGGDPDVRAAKNIYFPIVTDESNWTKELKAKVPMSWPEATEALKISQPFAQEHEQIKAALFVLQGMHSPDKHRNLSLAAVSDVSMFGVTPVLSDNMRYSIILGGQPAPPIELQIGNPLGGIEISQRVPGTDNWETMRRSDAPTMTRPADPKFTLVIRNGDFEINVQAFPELIMHVAEILSRFKKVDSPPA